METTIWAKYDFTTLNELFAYILGSHVNGNFSQVKRIIGELNSKQQTLFVRYCTGENSVIEIFAKRTIDYCIDVALTALEAEPTPADESFIASVHPAQQTGGNIFNDIITLKNGYIIRIAEDSMGVSKNEQEDEYGTGTNIYFNDDAPVMNREQAITHLRGLDQSTVIDSNWGEDIMSNETREALLVITNLENYHEVNCAYEGYTLTELIAELNPPAITIYLETNATYGPKPSIEAMNALQEHIAKFLKKNSYVSGRIGNNISQTFSIIR